MVCESLNSSLCESIDSQCSTSQQEDIFQEINHPSFAVHSKNVAGNNSTSILIGKFTSNTT